MAANESISGMITKTTQMLYDNLKTRYDSGFPILKELIQNISGIVLQNNSLLMMSRERLISQVTI